jgi:glycosyltransferase involved in cell wall biosynthesis
MKIVRIIARLNVGGPARHVVWLARELADEFETVLVAGTVPPGEEDMGYLADESGIEPVFIKEMSRELSPKDVVSLWKIFRLLKKEHPDIIHTHTAKAGTIGRTAGFLYRWLTWKTLVGKPRRVKIVHTFHGHIFHSYYGRGKTKLFVLIEKALAKFATDKIIVISEQQLREIHNEVGIGKTEKFAVVPLGIDLDPFASPELRRERFRKEIGVLENEILVSFVGRLTEIKNIPMFLDAAAAVKKKAVKPLFKFAVVGDGHLRESLEKQAAELGISDILAFAGNRKDTEDIYAASDIVGLTSLNEGTPLSLIEAMAGERAVVSTLVGGVVDLLGETKEERDGFSVCERGLGVASGDADGFANALLYLANEENLRKQFGGGSKKFVDSKYSKERLVEDIRKIYREL